MNVLPEDHDPFDTSELSDEDAMLLARLTHLSATMTGVCAMAAREFGWTNREVAVRLRHVYRSSIRTGPKSLDALTNLKIVDHAISMMEAAIEGSERMSQNLERQAKRGNN